ncbi:sensor histidine kinase [Faecalicatena orotica]|uniref:histidine kinase n=1 Tax=Faecalicatena orotica TaxID=1544 RepID=A0A2Y9BKZ9_9FIRM|nr:sensor histidine kinase [Faecalicatena orotica]PWJ19064.1 histidine kinase/DNA gyrase B/HSP90-like ATPase [Faecalicatena orotica]SSA58707.1 Histidine kinase-, DNA gyrase B-, and HSP90-like ATPase [Faecalicatena orotica]
MKKRLKLRNAILITIILITAVIVLIFGYVSSQQFEELLTERMVDDYQETVNTMQKNVETLITYMEDFTKYLSLNQEVQDTIIEYQNMEDENRILSQLAVKQKWDKFSSQLIFSTSMIYSLEIYTGENKVYTYYYDPMESDAKNIPDEILKTANSQSQPIWTDLLTLRQYRSYVKKPDYGFAVVKSVNNQLSGRVGAIAVYVRESSFAEILEPKKEERKNRYYLVNADDTIVSAVNKEELYEKANTTLELSKEEYEKCMQDGVLLKEEKGQDPLLYVSRMIGKKGIKLVCETTMDELGEQQNSLKIFIGIMMFFAVILATVSAWFVSNRVTKPLGELMGVMEKIKTEDKNSHLRFQERDTGEIGVLGSRFNELMDELDASMQQIYEEQRQRRHNEVRLLQAQIVPHFLYNTMGIISSFIKLGMTEKALATIQNLVSFYRLSLSSGKEIITIKEEVELTRNYIELQQLRYIEYMEYTIECDEDTENVWIPKLTIQPLVENVLHHGLRPNEEKCQIHISVTADSPNEILKISVYDNGTGIKEERLKQLRESLETGKSITKSFGILNIHQRLKLIYGNKYHMEIESQEGEYTQFSLYLPLKGSREGETYV